MIRAHTGRRPSQQQQQQQQQ
jgi:hypothetical protein